MSRFRVFPLAFYRRDAEAVARDLLGRYLVHRVDGGRMAVRIVETEAYLGEGDRASHAWRGRPTARTQTLFRPGGCAYVYLVYGLHCLFNVVTGVEGVGTAVLVRAGEPVEGEDRMRRNRMLEGTFPPGALSGGPGRLSQALGIDRRHDGVNISSGSLVVTRGEPVQASEIAVGKRIGVGYAGKAAEWPLRFAERSNPHVSRPLPWQSRRA